MHREGGFAAAQVDLLGHKARPWCSRCCVLGGEHVHNVFGR